MIQNQHERSNANCCTLQYTTHSSCTMHSTTICSCSCISQRFDFLPVSFAEWRDASCRPTKVVRVKAARPRASQCTRIFTKAVQHFLQHSMIALFSGSVELFLLHGWMRPRRQIVWPLPMFVWKTGTLCESHSPRCRTMRLVDVCFCVCEYEDVQLNGFSIQLVLVPLCFHLCTRHRHRSSASGCSVWFPEIKQKKSVPCTW